MTRKASEVEVAVARTLRDSLDKLQRHAEDVNQALSDLVSACASARTSNTLPHLVRAQTAAASLAASLDVLSRFVTAALHPEWRAPLASQVTEMTALPEATEPVAETQSHRAPELLEASASAQPSASALEEPFDTDASEALSFEPYSIPAASRPVDEPSVLEAFDIAMLAPEEQELHRRANRVAKVSMQDIKMLRPDQVQLGKENNDLCLRLRDDIERAHKEYDRRFQAILDHPVDYFYAWMVEILGEGDPRALGEYPYRSPVLRQ